MSFQLPVTNTLACTNTQAYYRIHTLRVHSVFIVHAKKILKLFLLDFFHSSLSFANKAWSLSFGRGTVSSYNHIDVEGVTLVLPSRLFMLDKYQRILALS